MCNRSATKWSRGCRSPVPPRFAATPITRSGLRHWKTEIVASSVEMLSGKRKKDYAAESAAEALAAQATAMGVHPEAITYADGSVSASDAMDIAEEGDEEDVAALVAA
ncbi:MAG: hypothetical protein ABIP53_03460 [Candidatus Limnocylindrales bacterium]